MVRLRAVLSLLLLASLILGACQPVMPTEGVPEEGAGDAVLAPTILVQGPPFHGANGINFGPDGNLYIASVDGDEIVVMDPETGAFLERYGSDDGVLAPDDLAFAPDGSVFFASLLTGKVGHITTEGDVEYVAELTMGVNPITFSDDGRLFVAQCFMDDKLYEVDPAGIEEPRLISDQLGPNCGLNGMDWGPDGYLYGPRWFEGEVVRVDVETGEFTTVADGFGVPAAVKFNSQGELHVLDTMVGEISHVDITTGEKDVVATLIPGLDNLAFDADDHLYVSSFTDALIMEVFADGTTRTVSQGGMKAPGGVAIMQTPEGESIFVADFFSLREFDPNSGELKSLARTVFGASELYMPTTVSAHDQQLLLSSWPDNVVWTWDPATQRLLEEYRNVRMPLSAIWYQDAIVVTELGTSSVVQLDGTGEEDRTVLVDGLAMPTGLATDGQALWVADAATGQVVQIADNGQLLAEPLLIVDGLAGPEGLAVAADGSLLVIEAGAGRLTRIDPATGAVDHLAEDLALGFTSPTAVPTSFFNGVAVSQDGTIFVSGDIANHLYRIESPF